MPRHLGSNALSSTKIPFGADAGSTALVRRPPRSLSDLGVRREGKRDRDQNLCKFEANSGLFNEDLRKFWPISAFPQQNHPKSDRLLAEAPGREPLYFYPGTASHQREMAWLAPVVKAVQSRVPGARFDIFGKSRLVRLFSGIPGVRVLPPMPWPEFLQYSCRHRYAVGLAPLFDTPFNLARSHNKFFDITRCGAAGIYSDVGAFRDWVVDDKTGLLRSNDMDDWVAAICDLLTHPEKRLRLYRGALAQCRVLSSGGSWNTSGHRLYLSGPTI